MDQRIGHSKIKNTGILFELLTRQITADVLKNRKSTAVGMVKKYFNEKTELGKENQLYEILLNKKFKSENRASYLIDAVIKNRKNLNNSQLRREKYNLIKEIKETYDVNEFFKARISNYRTLASIYKVFQCSLSPTVFDPSEQTDSRYTIVEHITQKKISSKDKQNTTADFREQDSDLRLLSYQILVDKFNEKYSSLNSNQRNLLREYINNISNTNSLKELVDSEVSKVIKELKNYLPRVDDAVTRIKLAEVIKQAKKLTNGNIVKDKQIVGLMRYYELIKELKNVTTRQTS